MLGLLRRSINTTANDTLADHTAHRRRSTATPRSGRCTALLRLLALDGLTILAQINLQRLHVLIESQGTHGPQQIVPVDRLAFLLHAFIRGLGGHEGYEFGYGFLDRLFGIFTDFGVGRKGVFHYARYVGYGQVSILCVIVMVLKLLCILCQ